MSRPPLHMITISSREKREREWGGPAAPTAFTWWAFRVWTRSRGGETNPVIAFSRCSGVVCMSTIIISLMKSICGRREETAIETHTHTRFRYVFCTTHCTFYCHLCHQQHRHIIAATRLLATHTTTTYTNELKVEIESRNNLILTRARVTTTLPHIICV